MNNTPECLNEELLLEKTRQELINKSRNADNYTSKGRENQNRYTRRLKSQIANSVRDYNRIDMDAFWKGDILDFDVHVKGETNNYIVQITFENILKELQREVKGNNNKLEFKCVLRALLKSFNGDNVYISCSCLHPSTKIKLLDGTNPTVEELEKRFNAGEKLYVYSTDAKGDFKPGEIEKVWITKRTTEFIKVTLDNGEEIITTPDHLYMLRDGTYKCAEDLVEGQSLMPMYFNEANGYTLVKLNSMTRGWKSVYKEVANYYKEDEIIQAKERALSENSQMNYDVAIHHSDFNKHNNNPENLKVMTAKEHWDYHASLCGENRPITDHMREVSRENAHKRNTNPTQKMIESRKEWQEKGRLRNYDEDRRQQQSQVMKNWRDDYYSNMSEEEKQRYSEIMSNSTKKIWERGCFNTQKFHEARVREGKRLLSNLENQLHMRKCKMLKTLQRMIDDNVELTEENYNIYRQKNRSSKVEKVFNSFNEMISEFNLNHKVVKIERITLEETPVYDIKVKDWENFVVDAGVVLHNCPDWKYRMAYWATKNQHNSGQPEVRPSDITNPSDSKGAGCKHSLLVISNLDWMMKIASVINNYIKWCKENMARNYADYIFPKVYGMPYNRAIQLSLFDDPDDNGLLPSDQETISKVIDKSVQGRDERGRWAKGNEYRFQPREKTTSRKHDYEKDNALNLKFGREEDEDIPNEDKELTIDNEEN